MTRQHHSSDAGGRSMTARQHDRLHTHIRLGDRVRDDHRDGARRFPIRVDRTIRDGNAIFVDGARQAVTRLNTGDKLTPVQVLLQRGVDRVRRTGCEMDRDNWTVARGAAREHRIDQRSDCNRNRGCAQQDADKGHAHGRGLRANSSVSTPPSAAFPRSMAVAAGTLSSTCVVNACIAVRAACAASLHWTQKPRYRGALKVGGIRVDGSEPRRQRGISTSAIDRDHGQLPHHAPGCLDGVAGGNQPWIARP